VAGAWLDTGEERLIASTDGPGGRSGGAITPVSAAGRRRRDTLGPERQRSLSAPAGPPGTSPRQGALLGTITGVMPEKGGVLVVGTAQGLARYSPAIVAEAAHSGGHRFHRIRRPLRTTRGGCGCVTPTGWWAIENGKIAPVSDPQRSHTHRHEPSGAFWATGALRSYPTTGNACCCSTRIMARFGKIPHPSGNQFQILASRPDGTAYVWVGGEKPGRFRLEIFDGTSFRPGIDTEIPFHVDYLKFIPRRPGLERCGSADPEWLGRLRNGNAELNGRQRKDTPAAGGYASASCLTAADGG